MKKKSFKSFKELNNEMKGKTKKKRMKEKNADNADYDKTWTLLGNIYIATDDLGEKDNGILEENHCYKGTNEAVKRFFDDQGNASVRAIIEKFRAYAYDRKSQELSTLEEINRELKKIIRRSNEIDAKMREKKRRRDAEMKRRQNAEKKRQHDAEMKRRLDEKIRELKERRIDEEREREEQSKAERIRLEEIIRKRKIQKLVHFSQLDNLKSILDDGIIPREELQIGPKNFCYNDKDRRDEMRNCSCVTIEFPNTKLLKSKIYEYPDKKWVILFLDPKLLFEQRNYYAEHNAATASVKPCLKEKYYTNAFEKLFDETVEIQKSGEPVEFFIRDGLKDYLPTSEQAEILVEGKIDSRFIQCVVFQNEECKRRFEGLLKEKGIDARVNWEWFIRDRNYFTWEDR